MMTSNIITTRIPQEHPQTKSNFSTATEKRAEDGDMLEKQLVWDTTKETTAVLTTIRVTDGRSAEIAAFT